MRTALDIKTAARMELERGARLDFMDRAVCLRNLQFIYHAIRATEDLLLKAGDGSQDFLGDYFARHRAEEAKHAQWLEGDLQGDTARASMLCASMVGAQLYLVQFVDPCALLGYQLVLECFPWPIEQLEAMERQHGVRLFRTLRHHAVHDVDHGAEVLKMIDLLSADRRELVFESAIHTARCVALASHSFVTR